MFRKTLMVGQFGDSRETDYGLHDMTAAEERWVLDQAEGALQEWLAVTTLTVTLKVIANFSGGFANVRTGS